MTTIHLLPGETMAQYRARVRMDVEAAAVLTIVRCNPGIADKYAIAALMTATPGFDADRAGEVVRALNRNETKHKARIDYGRAKARSGPYAGRTIIGWFPMDVAAYQHVMTWADWHSSRVEAGVRLSRLHRRMYALGLNTKQAAKVVAEIEEQMKVPVEKLSPAEMTQFDALAVKAGVQMIRMNGN